MTFSFHFHHPDDPHPKLPKPDRSIIEIDDVPAEKLAEREALLLEALPFAKHGYWDLLGESTKRELSALGLIALLKDSSEYQTTLAAERLFEVIAETPADAQTYLLRVLRLVTCRFGAHATSATTVHLQNLLNICGGDGISKGEDFALQVRKLAFALFEDENLALGNFSYLLEDILKDRVDRTLFSKNLQTYLTSKDYYFQREALHVLFEIGRHNSPPFLDGRRFAQDRAEVRHRAESIITRSYKYTHSFTRFQSEAQRIGDTSLPLLAMFGERNFEEAWRLKAFDKNRAPGPGFLFSNPKMENLFFQGRQATSWYAEAYQAYGKAFEQFPRVSYLATRLAHGIFIDAPEYYLPVGPAAEGRKELYCGLLANNHFTGSFELFGLFPVKVVRRHILPCLEELNPGTEDADARDVTDPGFNLESLANECAQQGLPALRLANISTAFGGMVAAYPKTSEPFYEWEPSFPAGATLWQDALGRVHHAWRARHYDRSDLSRSQLTRKRIEILKPLGEGCRVVADAAEGMLNLLDLLMFRYDAFKCGLTPGQPSQSFMLREALREHRVLREQGAPEERYRNLYLVDRYDWSATPQLLLDTHSLTLHLPDGATKKLSIAPGGRDRAEALWEQFIVPEFAGYRGGEFQESNKTLAMLPRFVGGKK